MDTLNLTLQVAVGDIFNPSMRQHKQSEDYLARLHRKSYCDKIIERKRVINTNLNTLIDCRFYGTSRVIFCKLFIDSNTVICGRGDSPFTALLSAYELTNIKVSNYDHLLSSFALDGSLYQVAKKLHPKSTMRVF
jgi:hypothetical protein